jgi:hypothetical protein
MFERTRLLPESEALLSKMLLFFENHEFEAQDDPDHFLGVDDEHVSDDEVSDLVWACQDGYHWCIFCIHGLVVSVGVGFAGDGSDMDSVEDSVEDEETDFIVVDVLHAGVAGVESENFRNNVDTDQEWEDVKEVILQEMGRWRYGLYN